MGKKKPHMQEQEEIIRKFMGCESVQVMLEFEYEIGDEYQGVIIDGFESAINAAQRELDVTDSCEFIFTHQEYTNSYDLLFQAVESIEMQTGWKLMSGSNWAKWDGCDKVGGSFHGDRFECILDAVIWGIENGFN